MVSFCSWNNFSKSPGCKKHLKDNGGWLFQEGTEVHKAYIELHARIMLHQDYA
jgi:hypothetical protein